MKVVGQSTLADGSPYVHLAYVSAVNVEWQSIVWNSTPLAIISGAAIALIAGAGGLLAWLKPKRPAWAWPVVICSMLAAVVTLAVAISINGTEYKRVRKPPANAAERVRDAIVDRNKDDDWLPKDMAEVGSALGISTMDEWSREMRLERTKERWPTRYLITSAGPDGRFSTADDIQVQAVFPYLERPTTSPSTRRGGQAAEAKVEAQ